MTRARAPLSTTVKGSAPRPAHPGMGRHSSLASFLGFSGAVLILVLLLALRNLPPADALSWLPPAYLVVNVLFVVRAVVDPRSGAISLMVAVYFLLFVAMPAVVQIDHKQFPFGGIYDSVGQLQALQIMLVGQLSYYVGEALAYARDLPTTARARTGKVELDSSLAFRALVIALGVSVATIFYVGPEQLLLPRFVLSGYTQEAGGLVGQVVLVGRSISLFGVLVALVSLRSDPPVRGMRSATVAMFVAFAILNFPPSLPRFQWLGAGIAIGCLLVSVFRTSVKAAIAVASPLFLVIMFPVIKLLGNGTGANLAPAVKSSTTDYLLSADFDSFKQTVDVWLYTRDHAMRGLESLEGTLLFWVPRSLWPGKPVHSGELVSSAHGYTFVNVASPLPAEGFLAFGLVGTMTAMVLFGWLVCRVERRVSLANAHAVGSPTVLVLYALIAGATVILLRGALVSVAPMLGPGFVAYALLSWAQARRNSRAST